MKWCNKEIDDTLYLLKSGKTYKEISEINGRSEASIRNKMNEFGEKSSNYKNDKLYSNCTNCEKEFKYDKNRKFCSNSCSAKFNNKKRKKEKGNCLNCGIETNRIGNKYCSNKCQGLNTNKKIFERIENGDLSFHQNQYKKYLIYKNGEKCMECNWNKTHPKTGKVPIQLEHIDGNSTNNSLENLKLLCPNCHSLTLTFGALNKGNGRKNRKR